MAPTGDIRRGDARDKQLCFTRHAFTEISI
jgi:hypothetical protein